MHASNRGTFAPPYSVGTFNAGEFIYDPSAPWEALRSGMIVERDGGWFVSMAPLKLEDLWEETPLATYPGELGRQVLVDNSGLGRPRGPPLDPSPWFAIRAAALEALRDAERRRLRLEPLLAELKGRSGFDSARVEDTVRMMSSMGTTTIHRDAGGLWLTLSESLRSSYDRKDYLASFSDELLAKSRRIDSLIRHTGTVGSYREELVRAMIGRLLPARYQVSTGFLENCARQLDVIVWDAERYAPLFREGDVVVVPTAAVRAIVEVKTTLDTGPLDEALGLLYEVLRVEQPMLPIFKGIFAFESDYGSDKAVAARMQTFYNDHESSGYVTRRHRYLGQGVTAVCVPRKHYVYQRYVMQSDERAGPYPVLLSLLPDWPGDVRTGVFLGELLSYLDLDLAPKRTLTQAFMPIFRECQAIEEVKLFGEDWLPTLAAALLRETLKAKGAQEYIRRFEAFRSGMIAASDVCEPPPQKQKPPRRRADLTSALAYCCSPLTTRHRRRLRQPGAR